MDRLIQEMLAAVDADEKVMIINSFTILNQIRFFELLIERKDREFIPQVLGLPDSEILNHFRVTAGERAAISALADFAKIVAEQPK